MKNALSACAGHGARVVAGLSVGLSVCVPVAPAPHADPLPTIATYELSKARKDARAIARDPKTFWVGAIVSRIESRKPQVDLKLKQPTSVEIAFTVARDGRVVSKQIARSSGNPAVDRQAVAVIDKAAPFPPMPDWLAETEMSFRLPLRFK